MFLDCLPRDLTHNYVVVHYDESYSKKSTFRWLRRKGNSYHFYIQRDGTVTNLVPDSCVANHAGLSYYDGLWGLNQYSIGIALQNKPPQQFTKSQYIALTNTIKKLRKKYPTIDVKKIVGHSQVAFPRGRKKDPGKHFDWQLLRRKLRTK